MPKSNDLIMKLIAAGGNIIVNDSSSKSLELMNDLVRAAVRANVHITFKNCMNKSVDVLIQVASNAEGHATFEI